MIYCSAYKFKLLHRLQLRLSFTSSVLVRSLPLGCRKVSLGCVVRCSVQIRILVDNWGENIMVNDS